MHKHSSTCKTSGKLTNLGYVPPDKLYYTRNVDTEEDILNLGQLCHRLDTFQAIMFSLPSLLTIDITGIACTSKYFIYSLVSSVMTLDDSLSIKKNPPTRILLISSQHAL